MATDLGSSPYAAASGDGKWGDFRALKEMDSAVPEVKPEDQIKAQIYVVVTARRAGLSNVESKEMLSALGIDEKVELNDAEGD